MRLPAGASWGLSLLLLSLVLSHACRMPVACPTATEAWSRHRNLQLIFSTSRHQRACPCQWATSYTTHVIGKEFGR